MVERHESHQFDSFYYQGAREQMDSLADGLVSMGFEVDPDYNSLDSKDQALILEDSFGNAVVIFKDLGHETDRYTAVVDQELSLLVEESFSGIELYADQESLTEEANKLTPPDPQPNFVERIRNLYKTHQDNFGVWERVQKEQVDEIKEHIEKYHPEFKLKKEVTRGVEYPDEVDVYANEDDQMIVLHEMDDGGYRVKANIPVMNIIENFLGPENAPPIDF